VLMVLVLETAARWNPRSLGNEHPARERHVPAHRPTDGPRCKDAYDRAAPTASGRPSA